MFSLQKPGWFGKQLEDTIARLHAGDESRILWVFCVLAEKHNPSKLLAAEALNRFLASLSYADTIRIDARVRQTTSVEWSIDWRHLDMESLLSNDMGPDLRRAVAVFASFHPNGYLREQAVRMMGGMKNTLAYVLLRHNDWVPQVRQAAERSYAERMEDLAPGELLFALPFADKLTNAKYGATVEKLYTALTVARYRNILSDGLQSADIRIRRLCVHSLLNDVHPDRVLFTAVCRA